MQKYKTPGIYKEERHASPAQRDLETGIPAFIGFAVKGSIDKPEPINAWPQFEERFGGPSENGYLYYAVRGFFENHGKRCRVVGLNKALTHASAIEKGLEALEPLDDIDLICAPDTVASFASENSALLQQKVLDHCEQSRDRFAILDSIYGAGQDAVLSHRSDLTGKNGALYYPWIRVSDGPSSNKGFVPPSGHIAGVFFRSDERIGVHKAPANEVLEGALDLEQNLTNSEQGELNPQGINCLRAFPGRGIRIWGARTLAGQSTPEWTYVNVRRLFLTAIRWMERNMRQVTFEPNDFGLWARIGRELTTYFNQLYDQGALKGSTRGEAFYVKCDAETNPEEVRDQGMVVTEIGLAPAVPNEFIVVRIIHGAAGVTILKEDALSSSPITPAPDTPLPKSTGSAIRISHLEHSPKGIDIESEHVRIENRGSAPVSMTNWTLYDLNDHIYTFPKFELAPGKSVRVWTKSGPNTQTDLYWGRRIAVWSNIGDRARIRNDSGELIDSFTYTPIDRLLSKR